MQKLQIGLHLENASHSLAIDCKKAFPMTLLLKYLLEFTKRTSLHDAIPNEPLRALE